MSAKVFISGASGFVAGHIIELLLKRGYQVIGTVRSLKNDKKVEHLRKMVPEKQDNLKLVEVDLDAKEKWVELMEGCDYLLHTASPFVFAEPKDPNEIIKPALQGTENVISAALKNNIKKIVLTSSVVSVYPGNEKSFYTSDDWSVLDRSNTYERSKHLAEKRAWELIEEHKKKGGEVDLAVILPGFIQGPSHSKTNTFQSQDFFCEVMQNKVQLAKVSFAYVDVREIALAHVNAMEREKANGKRYLIVQGSYWMGDVAAILNEEFKKYGYKIPSSVLGNGTMKFAACFDKQARSLKPMLGKFYQYDNSGSIQDLDIKYRPIRETLLDTVYDLIGKGRIPNKLPQGHKQTHRTNQFDYE